MGGRHVDVPAVVSNQEQRNSATWVFTFLRFGSHGSLVDVNGGGLALRSP